MLSRKGKISFLVFGFTVLILIFFVWGSGKLLDMEAERVVHQLYPRDQDGIIDGLQSVAITEGHKKALVLIHGFFSSPTAFSILINDVKNKLDMDIYAPLMPFQGRDLETGTQLDTKIILNHTKQYINDLSKKYQSITVVAESFGGAVLTDLAEKGELPQNVNLILYSPAIFLKTNTSFGRLEVHLYGLWRNYCNYPAIGCNFPPYHSGDTAARPMFDEEKTLQYLVMPALLQMYQLDLDNREGFSHIQRSYSLIIAVDDNRVSYEKQKAACETNKKYCHFYSFPSGKHMIHWGANKKAFENLLIKLTNEP